jgi:hypothetical protein
MVPAELSTQDRRLIETAKTFLDEREAANRRRRDSLKAFSKSRQVSTNDFRRALGAQLLSNTANDAGRIEEQRLKSREQIQVFLDAQRNDAAQRAVEVSSNGRQHFFMFCLGLELSSADPRAGAVRHGPRY